MIPMFCKDRDVSSPRNVFGFLPDMLLVKYGMRLDKNVFDKRNCVVEGTKLKIFDWHFLAVYMLPYICPLKVVLICSQSYEDFSPPLVALMSYYNRSSFLHQVIAFFDLHIAIPHLCNDPSDDLY
jgi:hypothetical protein